MEMQTVVDNWRSNAERYFKDTFRFLRSLKMKDDRAVDRVVHRLHAEAFAIVDCTKCANCCKTSSPLFRKSDVRRIAEHLGMQPADFNATYYDSAILAQACHVRTPITANDTWR